jgi:RNA polymerase sigma-70 factor (ECF subfamily)
MAANKARHYLRAARRRRQLAERFAREPHPSEVEQPEQKLDRSELATALARALDHLSLPQRVAFVLCEIERRSSAEVAAIVGAPEGTVRTRVHHARKKLRRALGEGDEP